ncbi:sensor histidine kinase [Actinomadura sp. NEAU-AAG7]|uniref:sensor histidine kinase n=1 Tax=Actinomadura sp. NEAU-AAG7 TaxID=2839640 RepID=UPI001BE45C53|nr:sensor histidine kinase [Actinomadura sp. NEAU-AAG7]MBT2211312.1 two-component sensor histidine kinase [Actinomadura sp. NEAU-AAG7]
MRLTPPPAPPGRDLAADAVAVVCALALSLQTAAGPDSVLRGHHGATAAVVALPALALAVRRRFPMTVAWLTAAVAALLDAVERLAPGTLLRDGPPGAFDPIVWWPPALPFAVYAAMAFPRDGDRPVWARALPVVALVPLVGLTQDVIPDESIRRVSGQETSSVETMVFRSMAMLVAAALLGMYAAARRRVLQGLTERAERAERERHLLAERARAEERARLAAEMHDVVAHRVTLMVLRAGALRVRAPDEETRVAAEELRDDGCHALEELRDVIGLLRRGAGAAGAAPAPASGPLPDLSALVAESAAVGVRVELVERGEPAPASPAVGRTAYRVVQEALTNARKHAPGAAVRVEVGYRSDGVRLSVLCAAPERDPDAALAASGSGTGLAGLRERVETVGGTFSAGPAGDGFRVEASLPAYVPLPTPPAP